MHFKYIFLMIVLVFGSSSLKAQSATDSTANEITQRQINQRARREQQMIETARNNEILARERIIQSGRNGGIVYDKTKASTRNNPVLTKRDLEAISINQIDKELFADFLKQPNTGIVRLQNGSICSIESLVVQSAGNCPNNITGKATSYSFRKSDYTSKILADVFFTGDKLSSEGVFTFGIFTSLGQAEIEYLNETSDGIKQLIEFQPAEDMAEINKQHQMIAKGIQVGDYIYKRSVKAVENTSYVLRTVAYQGKIFQGTGAGKINILKNDDRKDLTLIFRIIRKHDDGSVTLLWKELQEKPSPKIVLEEKEKKQPSATLKTVGTNLLSKICCVTNQNSKSRFLRFERVRI